jgi:outer membrane protein assembly factor BamB
MRPPNSFFVLMILLAAAYSRCEDAEWPAGWNFRANVEAREKAESYDVSVEHGGLAQPDGRDVRVFGPDKKPVSHLISFADETKFRVIFDGDSGPGAYSIFIGNLSPQLPSTPQGVSELGRKDWKPKGGFTSTSYDPLGPVNGRELLNLKNVLSYYDKVIEQAQTAENENNEKESNPAKRKKFVQQGIFSNANVALNTPDQWFHIFRAEINVTTAGKYDFVVGNGLQSERFGVVFVDADRATPAVPGWFIINFSPICVGITGQVKLSAGPHVLEMYTNRKNPELRLGLTGSTYKMPEYINGSIANYTAVKLTPGAFQVQQGTLSDGYHKIIGEWLEQGRYTMARALCKHLRDRASGDAELTKTFTTEFERVNSAAYAKNWATEGKYPSRTGAVAGDTFAPPLKAVPLPSVNSLDDKPHASGSAWVEGRHIYGLPYNIQDLPWGVTSSICIEDNVLFVGTKNGVMHAVELSKGTERWSFACGGPSLGAPLVYQGMLFFGSLDRRLYAIDIEQGRMAWNFPANGWIEGGACAGDGRVYFGSLDKHLYAIDAALGIQRWKTELGGPICATPTTDGKLVYVGTKTGECCAVDATSGSVVWKYSAGAPIYGGCCVGKERVVFGDKAGRIHALNTSSGKLAWTAACDVGSPVLASPILIGDVVYGGTGEGNVFGIELGSGKIGWRDTIPGAGEISRPPLFADGNLVFTSKMRGLFASPDGTPAVIAYQSGFQQQPCLQAAGDIAVDGALNEPSWNKALRYPLLRADGFTPAEVSDVRVLWDAKTLYLGVTCKDSDLVAGNAERDGNLRADDSITITLDPRLDGLAVYQFTLSPRGTQADALLTGIEGSTGDPKGKQALDAMKLEAIGAAWNPAWTSAVKLNGTVRTSEEAKQDADQGWTAEIAIPFDSLPKGVGPIPAHGARWRLNVIYNNRSAESAGVPAIQTLSVSPPVANDGIGTLAKWPVIQFLHDKVKP